MGLYGMCVTVHRVSSTTCAAPGTAYPAVGTAPAVTYNPTLRCR